VVKSNYVCKKLARDQTALPSYATTKEAICGLSRVVAREWGQYAIRVNVCVPNVVPDRIEILGSVLESQSFLFGWQFKS